ncbi:hypothetical protein BpHYR1_011098, partial [Brachionus plicatilis]
MAFLSFEGTLKLMINLKRTLNPLIKSIFNSNSTLSGGTKDVSVANQYTDEHVLVLQNLSSGIFNILDPIVHNTQNQNGAILEDALLNLNFALINNSSPTFHLVNRDYYEILDLYISSPNLLDKIYDFK